MNISIASFSFHGMLGEGTMDIFGYLESVKFRYRLDAADIWNGFLPTTDESFVRKVKAELDARELKLVNLAVDGAHLWEDDESVREQHRQNAVAHIRAAAALGAASVRIDVGGHGDDLSEEQFAFVVDRYREYVQMAHDLGMRLGPENHWGPSLVPGFMKKLAEAVDHPAFGILLHAGRWSADRDQGDALVARWAMHTHIDPSVIEGDLAGMLRTLSDNGYRGYFGIEDGVGVHEHEHVEWAIASLKRVLRQQ